MIKSHNNIKFYSLILLTLFSVFTMADFAHAQIINCDWLSDLAGATGDPAEDPCVPESPTSNTGICRARYGSSVVAARGYNAGIFTGAIEEGPGPVDAYADYPTSGTFTAECRCWRDSDGDGSANIPGSTFSGSSSRMNSCNIAPPAPPTVTITDMFTPTFERLTAQGFPVGTIAGTATAAGAQLITDIDIYIREKNDPNPACNAALDRDWSGTAWIAACQAAGSLNPTYISPPLNTANTTWVYQNTPLTSQMIDGRTYRVYARATDNSAPALVSTWIYKDALYDAASLPITLVVNGPNSGTSPFNVSLTATIVGGSGNVSYSFWWDCSNPSANVSTVNGACGNISPPAAQCTDSGFGHKCDGQAATSRTVNHTFVAAGIHVVKVIIERGGASGTAYATIRVTGDTQSAWQVQIIRISSSAVVYDSGQQSGTATSHLVTGQSFAFNNAQHYAQVRVWDAAGAPSNWVRMSICNDYAGQAVLCDPSETSFSSGLRFPEPAFTYTPTNPAPNQSVQFNGTSSRCYNASGGVIPCTIFNWSFGNANPGTASGPIVNTMFTTVGGNTVNLDVGTSAGVCSLDTSAIIEVSRPVPIWKEIIPFDLSL